jgi:hypothetical protein
LATADQQWQTAVQAYTQAISQCPDLADNQEVPIYEIYHHLMAQYLAKGKVTSARQTAFKSMQQRNAQDGPALKVLQVENLLQRYRQGEASVKTNGAPEPVHMAQFDMPNSAEGEDVLFTHPPAAVSYELDLPDEATALYFRMGMAPESWHWGGDGSTFIITVQENNEAPVELFREYVSNEPEDQIWHDAIVPLADYAGETVTITLQTDSGPAGDNTGDWAGWDTLRLIWAASS